MEYPGHKYLSPIGTIGAPCPPNETSPDLKFVTTVELVKAEIVAPHPI